METWAWLAAYVIGFALLQVYLYVYFIKGGRSAGTESTTAPGGVADSRAGSLETQERASDGELVSCATCGAYNENHQMYTFCKQCGGRIQ
jgi:hypothetical protein